MESQLIIPIITGILATLVGLGLGKLIFAKNTASKVEEAKKQAEQILNDAQLKAESLKREKLLEAKENFVQLKSDHEKDVFERNRKIVDSENRTKQKEQQITQKTETLEKQIKENESIKENLNRQIEIITQELACEVFGSTYAEFRVPSGAIANLYAFMATTEPGDTIIAPPATIGGHVTHHKGGSAGLYRLKTISAPVDETGYTIDIDALRKLAYEVKPKLITVGGSLNLFHHPIADVRAIADEVGAKVLFDAAHLCGMIAGKVWPQPLVEGAH